MSPETRRVREIFVAAVKLPPEQWERFLTEACTGDEELRRQVSELLQEHQHAGNFLDQPAAELRAAGHVAPAAAEEGPGTTIGPYKLLELIGEGGMGAVWMAEQSGPMQRQVALKIVKAGMDTRQVVARFEAERQALALMDHPHIAKVFDGGTTDGGRPYFAMELVKGTPITRYCGEQRLAPRQRLELFLPICRAIQHAHQKGIIHRDIKPANVLVAPYDGRPVPKVIDFGVAKAIGRPLTERTLFTGLGAVVGTLEYMSPEQAELNNQDIDTRSDIYALGVLLYELLTGTTPLSREQAAQPDFTETLRLIREQDPPRPSTRLSERGGAERRARSAESAPRSALRALRFHELDWIVMKALDKDRNRRYATANDLAADLERYLADEPVEACPPTVGYRLRKLARRNKGPMAAIGLVLLALVAGIIGMTWGLLCADKALSELQDQQTEMTAVQREKTLQLALARWNEARLSRQTRQPGQRWRSLEALIEAVRGLRSLDQLATHRLALRNDAIACLTLWDVRAVRRRTAPPHLPLPGIDPLGEHYASADAPNAISWRRVADDQLVGRWHWLGGPCELLEVSPDGRYVWAFCRAEARGAEPVQRVWDSVAGRPMLQRPTASWVHAFRPDGQVLALVQADGTVALYDLASGRDLPPLPPGPAPQCLSFHPSGRYLAVSSAGRHAVEVWDLTAAKVAFRLAGDHYGGGALAWSPDGSLLAIGSTDTNIYLCAFPGGNIQAVLHGHEHIITRLAYHPSGRLLASTGHDDTTRLWCFSPGGELVIPGEHLLGFSCNGGRLVTESGQRVTEWELLDPGDCLHYLPHGPGRSDGPWAVAFAPNGRLLASASRDGVRLWDAAAARPAGLLPSGDGFALAFHPEGRSLFTTGKGGLMQWPIMPMGGMLSRPESQGSVPASSRRESMALDHRRLRIGPPTLVHATSADARSLQVAVSSNGDWLLLGAGNRDVELVPLAAPARVRRLGKHDGLFGVALSPDGRWAASAGIPGNAVHVWDLGGMLSRPGLQGPGSASSRRESMAPMVPTVVQRLPPEGEYPGAVFSPDGRWLVSGVRSEFCFWEVGSWQRKAQLPRHPRSLLCLVSFTRDSRLLALADGRNAIHLHDAATLQHLATLEIPPGPAGLSGLSLSADGTRLAAATGHNVVALWNLRRLRQELAALHLDWDMPSYPPEEHDAGLAQPLSVDVVPAQR